MNMKEFFISKAKDIKEPYSPGYFMERGPEGGRTLDDYEEMLNFNRKELENKMVLDLGAGPGARLSKDLKKAGIKAEVVSLSPDYANSKYSKELKPTIFERYKISKDRNKKELAIAGIAEKLPFKEESFDRILALFSVSVWAESKYKEWLPEIMRVLKSEGCARIGPFHPPKMDMYDGDLLFIKHEEMKDYVKRMNFDYKFFPGAKSGQEVLVIYKRNRQDNK